MKITKFWAKGYRSLRDVTLDPLGDFNIFYGPNGAGKSNILDAIQTLFALIPLAANVSFEIIQSQDVSNILREDDFDLRQPKGSIWLGATFTGKLKPASKLPAIEQITIELEIVKLHKNQFMMTSPIISINHQWDTDMAFINSRYLIALSEFARGVLTHLGVTRTLTVDEERSEGRRRGRSTGTIPDGEVVRALFAAKNARDKAQRKRFDTVREFLAKHLHRGPLDVFMDGDTQQLELREQLPEPNPTGADISLDRAGHGVIQLYAIVATILLAEGRLVAIEEPEAHLHAPTLGRQLRSLLYQMVQEGLVSQLFVATHSNLFDLDSTGYWDVSLDAEGATQVKRLPLSEIDAHHLYEPGPAKHALAQLLRYAPESEVVYRRPDNTPITAGELLRLLQEDDDIALEFLRSLHGAALRIVRLNAKKEATPQ
jgi:predicted ATPase